MDDDLAEAAKFLGVALPALEQAAELSRNDITRFKEWLLEEFQYPTDDGTEPKTIDVVFHGAHARGEATPESDCDYIVLTSGASPEITQGLIVAVEEVRDNLGLGESGDQGTFGTFDISAELYERIGLEDDTNLNMTRRMLLLTESSSVYSEVTRQDVIKNILLRYCADYLPPSREKGSPAKVPHFLLNDLVRYWRTIAVDFGAKRWRSMKGEDHLRLAKLRVTRKILFAGPLATLLLVPIRLERSEELPEYLAKWLDKPPLAQLASTADRLDSPAREALAKLLVQYDNFIGILSQRGMRKLFNHPTLKKAEELRNEARRIGDSIQESLEIIFYDDPLLASQTRKYGVF